MQRLVKENLAAMLWMVVDIYCSRMPMLSKAIGQGLTRRARCETLRALRHWGVSLEAHHTEAKVAALAFVFCSRGISLSVCS